jgi:hypothetical protein
MIALPTQFKKNGLLYRLVERTDTKGLYELLLYNGDIVGYEVCKIHIREMRPYKGGLILAKESITRNCDFDAEKCKTFFPADLVDAQAYYNAFF